MNSPACLPRISDPQNVRAAGAGPGEADPTARGLALRFQGKTEAHSGAWAVPVTHLSLLRGTVLTPADFLLGRDWVGLSPRVSRLSQNLLLRERSIAPWGGSAEPETDILTLSFCH